ncbi:MAG: hypothetical protein RIA71_05370 [Oceanicaulis sp.]
MLRLSAVSSAAGLTAPHEPAACVGPMSRRTAWIIHPRIEGWIGGAREYTPSSLLCLLESG